MTIVITPQNVNQYPWLWSFLEEKRKKGVFVWAKDSWFTYKNQEYKFSQRVFARMKKSMQGVVYEMESPILLGQGFYAPVYKISCTISKGKHGVGARDKGRVVKIQYISASIAEYNVGKHAHHTHMKPPTKNGNLVMKNLGDETYKRFINSRKIGFTKELLLEITRKLLTAYKEQLVNPRIMQNDLHKGNILVKYISSEPLKFEINIVDFGSGYYPGLAQRDYNSIIGLIKDLWKIKDVPRSIQEFLYTPKNTLEDYINFFNQDLLLFDFKLPKHIYDLFDFINKLKDSNPDLSNTFKRRALAALALTENKRGAALQQCVVKCRLDLQEHNIEDPIFPLVIMSNESDKQILFNKISDYFSLLEQKARFLQRQPATKQQGDALMAVARTLTDKTYECIDNGLQKDGIKACQDFCRQQLHENQNLLNIHRNHTSLWAEVGVIFASLIVFYPLLIGANYLLTGKAGFFQETKCSAGTKHLSENFAALEALTA